MPTLLFGKQSIPAADLKADKKAAKKIGPVGMGKRAFYLNSFYISRMYYVLWTEVSRVYKQVAMSKGGFTGIGAFGAMSYLVVELRDGRTKKCQFKYENQTDQALAWIEEHHPEIPHRSVAAQKKLDEKKQLENRKTAVLDEQALGSILVLQEAKDYLEKQPQLYRNLSQKAGKKRVQQMVPARNRVLGISIFVLSLVLLAAGIPMTIRTHPAGIYMVMFGGAFLLFSLAGNLIPIGKNSPGRVEQEWQEAVQGCEEYISAWTGPSAAPEQEKDVPDLAGHRFPVPARYAHPIVLERMIRSIREGRAKTCEEALEVVKEDLRKLNHSVKVSQEEYDEVVVVKPMFLVSDYR